MSLLISSEALARRRMAVAVAGKGEGEGPLAPLASSLRSDLQALLDRGFEIPSEKALLSRDGGRCPRDGAPLEFDPFQPHDHRCPVCGEHFRGERHYLAWVMWYQLWLAERSVHAAALHALTGEAALAALATRILSGYADSYLRYPNRDNVLGPGRPFFSTYLESIWLLQLCVALDLLEAAGWGGVGGGADAGSLGGVVRDRIVLPSAAVISSFDEGASNRQVWNDAALIAAGLLLDDRPLVRRAVAGPSGILSHLEHGLLADGSWYEGENYHFFAHRGLWYGVSMAEHSGVEIAPALRDRFQEAFAAPLATALPDFTFPSRRDSQYGVSLRQWRFAEACELGLARADDRRLVGALHSLYAPDAAPRRDTGRWRSTAEAERNEPASALSRADLGWRSLLLARESPGDLVPDRPRSALLEGQGIAVLRRKEGRVYVALDYGQSGGGHGHPDRLNVLLMQGADRWLDDMGTGSYVDPSLHWYRSTLAHNAPLVNGRSQPRMNGVLRAFEEQDDLGWVDAELPWGGEGEAIASGVRLRRSLIVTRDYTVDRIEWASDSSIRFELPLHLTAVLEPGGGWERAELDGSPAPEDGFSFVQDAAFTRLAAWSVVRLRQEQRTAAWAFADAASEWWRARAPGAPGTGMKEFLLLRMDGRRGMAYLIWNWGAAIDRVSAVADGVNVYLHDGSRHEHRPQAAGWRIDVGDDGPPHVLVLSGARHGSSLDTRVAVGDPTSVANPADGAHFATSKLSPTALLPGVPIVFELGRDAYRVSEESWDEAGRPTATVELRVLNGDLRIGVDVRKSPLCFRAADAPDPRLDNEHPDIHSDGVQLYLYAPEGYGLVAWLVIPEPDGGVRTRALGDAGQRLPLDVQWRRTPQGYAIEARVPLASLAVGDGGPLAVQVVVNDMAPERVRRRGQLVMSGAGGAREHIYLRGDREQPANFPRFVVQNA